MAWLRGLIDRALLVGGVVAGGMVPSFLAQYRQRVGGALGQVLKDLAPFQQIADQFHGGSLARLIQHHLDSTDATFHAEGAAIQAMVDSAASLRVTLAALDTDVFHQAWYLLRHADAPLLAATWEAFRPGFGLNADSVAMALVLGLSVWALFMLLWSGLAWLLARRRR